MSDSDVDRIIGRITRKLLIVLIPTFVMSVGALLLRDHFLIKNKVDKVEFMQTQHTLVLLVEDKTRAIESLAKTNTQEIGHLHEAINKLDEYQVKLDEYLREEFRERGMNSLPKY